MLFLSHDLICLMAFQSFSGSLPACMRHVRVAFRHLQSLTIPHDDPVGESELYSHAPQETCLHSLSQTCRMTLQVSGVPLRPTPLSHGYHSESPVDKPAATVFQALLALISSDAGIESSI